MPEPIDLTGGYPVLPEKKVVAPAAIKIKKKQFFSPEEKSTPEENLIKESTPPSITSIDISSMNQIYDKDGSPVWLNPNTGDKWIVSNDKAYYKGKDNYIAAKNVIYNEIPTIEVTDESPEVRKKRTDDEIDKSFYSISTEKDVLNMSPLVRKFQINHNPLYKMSLLQWKKDKIDTQVDEIAKLKGFIVDEYGKGNLDNFDEAFKLFKNDVDKASELSKLDSQLKGTNKAINVLQDILKKQTGNTFPSLDSRIVENILGVFSPEFKNISEEKHRLESKIHFLNTGKELKDWDFNFSNSLDEIGRGMTSMLTNTFRFYAGVDTHKTYGDTKSPKEHSLWKTADMLDNMGEKIGQFLGADEDNKFRNQGLTKQFFNGMGTMIGFMIPTILTGGSGLTTALLGGATEVSGQFVEGVEGGYKPGDVLNKAPIDFLAGVTEVIPIQRMYNVLTRYGKFKGSFKDALSLIKESLFEGLEEGSQESLQQWMENFSTKLAYNPEQDLNSGMVDAFYTAFLNGFTMGAIGTGTNNIMDGVDRRKIDSKIADTKRLILDKLNNEHAPEVYKLIEDWDSKIKEGNQVKSKEALDKLSVAFNTARGKEELQKSVEDVINIANTYFDDNVTKEELSSMIEKNPEDYMNYVSNIEAMIDSYSSDEGIRNREGRTDIPNTPPETRPMQGIVSELRKVLLDIPVNQEKELQIPSEIESSQSTNNQSLNIDSELDNILDIAKNKLGWKESLKELKGGFNTLREASKDSGYGGNVEGVLRMMSDWEGMGDMSKDLPILKMNSNYIDILSVPSSYPLGTGAKIYNIVEQELKDKGYNNVFVISEPTAIKFWESMGFKSLEEKKGDRVVMSKDLNVSSHQSLIGTKQTKDNLISTLSVKGNLESKEEELHSKLTSKLGTLDYNILDNKTFNLSSDDISNLNSEKEDLIFNQSNKVQYGKYNWKTGEISLNIEAIMSHSNPLSKLYKTINHEKLHKLSHNTLVTDKEFQDNILDLLNYYKEKGDNTTDYYNRIVNKNTPYESMQEFIAEMFTNDSFQKEANNITNDKWIGNKKLSMFQKFVESVKEFLNKIGIKWSDNSLLAETIRVVDEQFGDVIQMELDKIGQSNFTNATKQTSEIDYNNSNELVNNTNVNEGKFNYDSDLENKEGREVTSLRDIYGQRIWSSVTEGVNEVRDLIDKHNGNQILSRDEFVSRYSKRISQSKQSELTKKANNGRTGIEDLFAYFNSKSQQTVVLVDFNGKGELVKTSTTTYTFEKSLKSTTQGKSLMEDIGRRLNVKGLNLDIYQIVSNTVWNEKKQKYEQISNIKTIDETMVNKLFESGYVLLPNKNTQYLIKVDKSNPYFQSMENMKPVEIMAKVFNDFTDEAMISVTDFMKKMKRISNILGDGKTGMISSTVEKYCSAYPEMFRVVDGKSININSAILNIDGNLPESHIKSLQSIGIDTDNFNNMDGADLLLEDTHDLEHLINGVNYEEWGGGLKYKISEEGFLDKSAAFRIGRDTDFGKWMLRNGIMRLHVDTAIKIDAMNRPGISFKDIFNEEDGSINTNYVVDKSLIFEENMMDDAFMFSKGNTKRSTGGFTGQALTNGISHLNPKLKSLIENYLNEATDKFVNEVKSWTPEKRMDMLLDFNKSNPDLVDDFPTLQRLQNLISRGKLSVWDSVFTNQFIKNILSKRILDSLEHRIPGSNPVLRPDSPIFEYRSRIRKSMSSKGMSPEDIAKLLDKAFTDEGHLKDDWMIVSQDIATKLGLKNGDEAIGTVNPPGSPFDFDIVKVLIIPNKIRDYQDLDGNWISHKVDKNYVVRSGKVQQIMGKDYDIDILVVSKLNEDLLKEISNLQKNIKYKEWDKKFNNMEIDVSAQYRLKGFTGTKEEAQEKLSIESLSDDYFKLMQLFGIDEKWDISSDIIKISNTLQGDLSAVKTAIGIIYNYKLLHQVMLECGYFEDNKLKGKNNSVYITKSNVTNNLMLFKHLTDLTIDLLSDQRILKTDINSNKILAYILNCNTYTASLFRENILDKYFTPIRNLFKTDLNIYNYDKELLGYNKTIDILKVAKTAIEDKQNPFKDSTMFKVSKYYIDNFKTLPRMTLTNEETQKAEDTIRKEINPPQTNSISVINRFLGTFYRMGLGIEVDYNNEPKDGRSLVKYISDLWYGKNKSDTDAVIKKYPILEGIDPIFTVFREMLKTGDYKLREGQNYASIKNFFGGSTSLNNNYHIFNRFGEKYTVQYVNKTNNITSNISPIFNNFEDYIQWHLNNKDGLGRKNLTTIFKSPILKDVFNLFEIRHKKILDLSREMIPKILQKYVNSPQFNNLSNQQKDYVLGAILGFYDNIVMNDMRRQGLNIVETSTSMSKEDSNVKIMNSSIGAEILDKVDNEYVRNYLDKYEDVRKKAYDSQDPYRLGLNNVPSEILSEEDDLSTDDIIDKECKKLKNNPSSVFFKPLMLYINIARKLGVKNIRVSNLYDVVGSYKFLNNTGTITRHSIESYFGKLKDGMMSGEMIDHLITSRLSEHLIQLKADMKKVWNNVYLSMSTAGSGFESWQKIGDYANLEGIQILISDIAEGLVPGIQGLKFNSEGSVLWNNEEYRIYRLPHEGYKGRVNQQNNIDYDVMTKLVETIIKDNKITPTTYGKSDDNFNMSIIKRAIASSISMRYAYDYYVPSILQLVSDNLEKQFQEAGKIDRDFLKETLIGEIKEAFLRVNSMIGKTKGKSEELSKQNKFYLPHIYSNLEQYEEDLREYYKKLGWESSKIEREVTKRMDEIENGRGSFGEKVIADVFFNERIVDLPHYDKSYQSIEMYFSSLESFISNMSHRIQSLLNEKHITQQSTKMQYFREMLHAKLEGADYRWNKLSDIEIKRLKEGDYIAFTNPSTKYGVLKGSGEVVSNINNKITLKSYDNTTKVYDMYQISNVRKQDRSFAHNESIQNFFREVESILSKNNLGFMNILFGTRNIIGGVSQIWTQWGKGVSKNSKGIKTTIAQITDEIEKYRDTRSTKTAEQIKDVPKYELYDIILDYADAIQGGVADFMGKLMDIADLEGIQSTDLVNYLNASRKEYDKDSNSLSKDVTEWRASKTELGNNLELSKGLKNKLDHFYKKYRGYNFVSMIPYIGKALDDNGKLGLILNPAKGEQWLRMRTASLILIKMMDDLNYDKNSSSKEWRDWFNKTFTDNVLAGVYETQVYYTPEFQASADTIPVTKFFTLWGHYGMSMQSTFFKNLRDLKRQLNEFNKIQVLKGMLPGTSPYLQKETELTIDGIPIVDLERNAGKIAMKQLLVHLSAELVTVIGYSGVSAMFDSIGLGVIGYMINAFYIGAVKNTSAIPSISVVIRGMIMLSTIMLQLRPPEPDNDDNVVQKFGKNIQKQFGKRFVGDYENWKINKQNYLKSQHVPKEYWVDMVDDKGSYYQELVMNFGYDGAFPGFGFNNVVDVTSKVLTSSIYGGLGENMLTLPGNKIAPFLPGGRQLLGIYNHTIATEWGYPWVGARNVLESRMYQSLQDYKDTPMYELKQLKKELKKDINKLKGK